MVAQGGSRHLARRSDPIAVPTGSGISTGAVTESSTTLATNSLAIDAGASEATTTPTAPIITVIQTETPTSSQTSATQAVAGASSKPISLGTVIGSCVGAFIGISALVILGIWFYRRYSESLNKQAMARGRNLRADEQRRRSRLEPWNKLEEGEDKWEGMHKTKEVYQVVPMEKLTMFKRGASIRTAYTQKSVDEPLVYPQSFAQFDTNLVRKLSADGTAVTQTQPSQDANSIKGQTCSTLSPSKSLGGPLSPSVNMAIPTPEATVIQPHKWESAEVHFAEGQSADIVESSDQDKDARNSQNPFFGSQDYNRPRTDSVSNEKSLKAKGKERMRDSTISSNPFEDPDTLLPKPAFIQHQATDSSASSQSKERAVHTLMVALELPEDEVRERLRIASMQPSVISQASQYSTTIDEEDFVKNFPLPPLGGNSS